MGNVLIIGIVVFLAASAGAQWFGIPGMLIGAIAGLVVGALIAVTIAR
jgi:uncharacterized membrane protein SpoIIM required for sporulation